MLGGSSFLGVIKGDLCAADEDDRASPSSQSQSSWLCGGQELMTIRAEGTIISSSSHSSKSTGCCGAMVALLSLLMLYYGWLTYLMACGLLVNGDVVCVMRPNADGVFCGRRM